MPDSNDPPASAPAYDVLIETWFVESFHGSVIARSTEAWNAVHAAKEDLKRRLSALLASCISHD